MIQYPLHRERYFILALLLALAAGAWALLIWQANQAGMMPLTASVFLLTWIVMMVAMMFPTAAPMILMFATIYRNKRQRDQPFVPSWVFVLTYMLVWVLFGVLAYLLALAAQMLLASSPDLMALAPRLGGVLLILAGLYQLSPLKRVCLSKCRSPLDFILTSWRDGYLGTVRMGLEHGVYCLGCCWLLFLILFPLGMMNIVAMALITLLIFAEKSLPLGWRFVQIAAVVLVAYGILVLFMPEALPVTMLQMNQM